MYIMKQSGWLELICGSMFSGKSEELIRRVKRATYAKQEVRVFKPVIDNRYSEAAVVSHNGTSMTSYAISSAADIWDHISESTDVVAVDEVQFFDQEIVEVLSSLADKGYRVIAAGLDMDFRGVFGLIGGLIAAILIYIFAWHRGNLDSGRIILVGIAINSGFSALSLFLSLKMDPQDYQMAMVWKNGSIWSANWTYITAVLPWMLLFIPIQIGRAHV